MKDSLEAFLNSLPDADHLLAKPQDAVTLFAYFLSEVSGQPITPARIETCYDLAGLKSPKNISGIMTRSGSFIRTKKGRALHRDAISRIKNALPAQISAAAVAFGDGTDAARRKTVMVVYGRDEQMRESIFSFLRCLDLRPVEWNDAVRRTRKASPYVGEILEAAFAMAQAFLVLMTPDEEVRLRPGLWKNPPDQDSAFQARPNVIFEAGMALAKDDTRTILVEVGPVRVMSDLQGRHVIRLDNSPERRNDLVQRLRVAGCLPNTDGTDWLKQGHFECSAELGRAQ